MIIIILGAGSPKKLSHETEKRLEEGVRQYKKHNASVAVYGKTENESGMMYGYLLSSGIKEVFKEEAANTALAAYSAKTKHFLPSKEKEALVVTSNFHLERIEYVFYKTFGDDYKLRFVGLTSNQCCGTKNIIVQKQRELTQKAINLLYNVRDGDHEAVKNKILEA